MKLVEHGSYLYASVFVTLPAPLQNCRKWSKFKYKLNPADVKYRNYIAIKEKFSYFDNSIILKRYVTRFFLFFLITKVLFKYTVDCSGDAYH